MREADGLWIADGFGGCANRPYKPGAAMLGLRAAETEVSEQLILKIWMF
jgi:hypothetical protein